MIQKKCYTQEENLLLLLDKFIYQLRRSDLNEYQITKKIYLFCIGYYLKYESNFKHNGIGDIDIILSILTRAIANSGSHVHKLMGNQIDVIYFYKLVVQYVISEAQEAKQIFLEFRAQHERSLLNQQVIFTKSKKGKRNFQSNVSKYR